MSILYLQISIFGNFKSWSDVNYKIDNITIKSTTTLVPIFYYIIKNILNNFHQNNNFDIKKIKNLDFYIIVFLPSTVPIDNFKINNNNILDYKTYESQIKNEAKKFITNRLISNLNNIIEQHFNYTNNKFRNNENKKYLKEIIEKTIYNQIFIETFNINGYFLNGVFEGNPTDFIYEIYYKLSKFFFKILTKYDNIDKIKIFYDTTHGQNYLPVIFTHILKELSKILSILCDIEIHYLNSDPVTSTINKTYNIHELLKEKLSCDTSFKIQFFENIFKLDGNFINGEVIPFDIQTIKRYMLFLLGVKHCFPLLIYRFLPDKCKLYAILKNYIEKYYNSIKIDLIFNTSIKLKPNSEIVSPILYINMKREKSLNEKLEFLSKVLLSSVVIEKIIKNNKKEISKSDIEKLIKENKYYSRNSEIYARLKRDIEKEFKQQQRNQGQIDPYDDPMKFYRNFFAHSGFLKSYKIYKRNYIKKNEKYYIKSIEYVDNYKGKSIEDTLFELLFLLPKEYNKYNV